MGMRSGVVGLQYHRNSIDENGATRMPLSEIRSSGTNITRSLESRVEQFRKRFRRSGSLGIPFVPEREIPQIKEHWTHCELTGKPLLTLIITTPRRPESLTHVLKAVQDGVRIQHIESREPMLHRSDRELLEVLIQLEIGDKLTPQNVVEHMKTCGLEVAQVACTVPPSPKSLEEEVFTDPGDEDAVVSAPWFPRHIKDLDKCSARVLMYGTELDADHPGFKDEEYRTRRMVFADIALKYKQGDPIPRIEYTETETRTWSVIYTELRKLHKKHACREYLDNFELLEKYCGYGPTQIPQLEDINRFLRAKTGFRVRPVAGYLSSRDFLAGLAFRVFNCTQYIRHPTDPFYTPEPDCCHELLGHMPLFADPDFAQFSQDMGLASLGASEDDVQQLSTLYFFSIEFGLCRQRASGDMKVYGAGLLSSAAELRHAVEDRPTIQRFDPDRVIQQECLITTFQAGYYFTENFEEAQQKLRMFTNSMSRPFVLRYNPYTESIEILNHRRTLTLAVNQLRSDVNLLATALHNIL